MATFTQRQAAKIISKSRTTVGRHIASGLLSCTRNEDGSVAIDASELIRVYGDECDFDRVKKGAKPAPESSSASDGLVREIQAQVQSLQADLLRQHRDEIEHLKEALAKAQDGQAKVTALLEGQSRSTGDWKTVMEETASRIANQTDAKIERLQAKHEEELTKLKRMLRAEREKGFWKRLLGQ